MDDVHKQILERYMVYRHLPEPLQRISAPVCDTAWLMAELCAGAFDQEQVMLGLQKMIEAKDCFVRAMLP